MYETLSLIIRTEIKQGCVLSMMLYIIAIEELMLRKMLNKNLKGYIIYDLEGREIKLTPNADDIVSATILNTYYPIQKDVYFSQYFHALIINNLGEISNINLNNSYLRNQTKLSNIELINKRKQIQSTKFNWSHLIQLNLIIQKNYNVYVHFINFEYFSINEQEKDIKKSDRLNVSFIVTLKNTKLVFIYKNKLVETCDQISDIESLSFINQVNFKWFRSTIGFKKSICPLVFRNASIDIFYLNSITDTFYSKRSLLFQNMNQKLDDLNSKISMVYLCGVLKFNLNEYSLHPKVFSQIKIIQIYGRIENIQNNLFEYFLHLNYFVFDGANFRQLINRIGAKWINSINSKVSINSSNMTQVLLNLKSKTLLSMVKLFSYELNNYNAFLDYPTPITVELSITNYIILALVNIFNFLIDFINYFVFMLLCLIMDVILIKKLKETIKQKHNLLVNNSTYMRKDKLNDLNSKSLFILILNTTLNIILRFPEVYNLLYLNMNTLAYFIQKENLQTKFFYFYAFLSQTYLMFFLMKLTQFLYITSLSLTFNMFYTFNSMFKLSAIQMLRNFFLKKQFN
ncbi:unnamed protein product [Brachionus calyciflorus]|uniref:Uncharacterized protein n=1 Tax=Brachionus calyciflorus TaxID=104777 RepID=A0A813VKZ4_9BILA|nr:unnamed protein product [Brachionus calyciflorus]